MGEGIKIGKLFGIEITIDPSWFLIFILITWNLAVGVFPNMQPEWDTLLYWIFGISASLLFFASVLAHEFAHSLVAKARGLPINRITLFLFGGVSNLEREPESPSTEFTMAIVGPITSIVLGFLFLISSGAGWAAVTDTAPISGDFIAQLSPIQTLLLWLGSVNIIVGLFNLLPGFPLDGGRILRSIIWSGTNNLRLSSKIASFVGRSFGYILIIFGISMIFGIRVPIFGTGLGGIWIAFIGWFLSSAAERSYNRVVLDDLLKDVPVKRLMRDDITPVNPDISISELVDNYMIGTDMHAFPVVEHSQLKGIVSLGDIQKIPREEWGNKKVHHIMTPFDKLNVADRHEHASEVLRILSQHDIGQVPVVDGKKLLGIVSRRDILLWLALSSKDRELDAIKSI